MRKRKKKKDKVIFLPDIIDTSTYTWLDFMIDIFLAWLIVWRLNRLFEEVGENEN